MPSVDSRRGLGRLEIADGGRASEARADTTGGRGGLSKRNAPPKPKGIPMQKIYVLTVCVSPVMAFADKDEADQVATKINGSVTEVLFSPMSLELTLRRLDAISDDDFAD